MDDNDAEDDANVNEFAGTFKAYAADENKAMFTKEI